MESLKALFAAGAARAVLGTVAITNPEIVAEAVARYGDQVAVGIDSREGMVAVEGWAATVEEEALAFAGRMAALGVKRAIFTDISRDGTLQGPNIAATRDMARMSGLKIIASGGIASLDDIRALRDLEKDGVEGAILGRALYNGNFTLEEALAVAGKGD